MFRGPAHAADSFSVIGLGGQILLVSAFVTSHLYFVPTRSKLCPGAGRVHREQMSNSQTQNSVNGFTLVQNEGKKEVPMELLVFNGPDLSLKQSMIDLLLSVFWSLFKSLFASLFPPLRSSCSTFGEIVVWGASFTVDAVWNLDPERK